MKLSYSSIYHRHGRMFHDICQFFGPISDSSMDLFIYCICLHDIEFKRCFPTNRRVCLRWRKCRCKCPIKLHTVVNDNNMGTQNKKEKHFCIFVWLKWFFPSPFCFFNLHVSFVFETCANIYCVMYLFVFKWCCDATFPRKWHDHYLIKALTSLTCKWSSIGKMVVDACVYTCFQICGLSFQSFHISNHFLPLYGQCV